MAAMRDSTISGTGMVSFALASAAASSASWSRTQHGELSASALDLLVGRRPQLLQHQRARLEQAAEEGVGLGPGGAQHQPVDALGMLDRQHLAHRAAGGMAAPMDLVEAQRIDQLQRVVGHLRDAVVDLDSVLRPVPR